MRRGYALVLSMLGLAGAGCSVDSDESDEGEEELGEAQQMQPDVGGANIKQNGAIVGAIWHGRLGNGTEVEYWVKKPGYSASASRTFEGTGSSTTCSAFRTMVCAWSGATYYNANFTHTTLNCSSPPGTIAPPGGGVSFLASGSYVTSDAVPSPFAWTYVSGNVEYWAMSRLISTTSGISSSQSALVPAYSSFNNFVTSVCALPSRPTEWLTQSMTSISNFCSVNPC
jgi:hypothetical protein